MEWEQAYEGPILKSGGNSPSPLLGLWWANTHIDTFVFLNESL